MQPLAVLSFLLASAAASPALTSRGSASCEVVGYDKGTDAYSYTKRASLATAEKCGAKCAADASCKSFAVGEGACLLYSKSVQSNVDEDDDSPFTFYDKACVSSSPSQPSASSKRPSARQSSVTRKSTKLRSTGKQSSRAPTPSSPPSSSSCNLAGYDKRDPEAFYYSDKASTSNYAGCSAACKKYTSCKSFAFGSGECLLYSAGLEGNFDAVKNSPYRFFDASCIAGSPTPSAPAVTTTPAASESGSLFSSLFDSMSSAVVPQTSSSEVPSGSALTTTTAGPSAAVSPNLPSLSSTTSASVSTAVVVGSSVISRPSSTVPVVSTPSSSLLCDIPVIDYVTPDKYLQPVTEYYRTVEGCKNACILSSCTAIISVTSVCIVFFAPAGALNVTRTDLVGDFVPRFSEAGCFSNEITSPIVPGTVAPPSTQPICGQGFGNADITFATFILRGKEGDKLENCQLLCTSLNCVSFAIDVGSGCVFFNNTVPAVASGPTNITTAFFYDSGCA